MKTDLDLADELFESYYKNNPLRRGGTRPSFTRGAISGLRAGREQVINMLRSEEAITFDHLFSLTCKRPTTRMDYVKWVEEKMKNEK